MTALGVGERCFSDPMYAWAAGIFEGEGSVRHRVEGGIQLKIAMTDLDVLEMVQTITQLGTITGPYLRPERKPIWYWNCSNRADLATLYRMFRPWLCDRRRAQFLAALYPQPALGQGMLW